MEFSVKWNCLDGAQKKYQEDLVNNKVSLLTSGLDPRGGGGEQPGLLTAADLAPLPRLAISAKPGRPPGGEGTSQVINEGCYFLLGPQLAGGRQLREGRRGGGCLPPQAHPDLSARFRPARGEARRRSHARSRLLLTPSPQQL